MPGLGAHAIFPASELGFCIASAAGAVLFLRRQRPERGRALWLLGYGVWGLALWAYRVALQGDFLPFHYFFVAQAVLAVFFGHLTVELGRRLGRLATGWRGAVLGLAWLSVLHGLALVAVVDSRRADASEFAAMRDVYPLLARLGPLDRIGVERPPGARAVTPAQLTLRPMARECAGRRRGAVSAEAAARPHPSMRSLTRSTPPAPSGGPGAAPSRGCGTDP